MISTVFAQPFEPLGCAACRDKTQLPFDFTMAFQPIMDLHSGRPFAYEALVRGGGRTVGGHGAVVGG